MVAIDLLFAILLLICAGTAVASVLHRRAVLRANSNERTATWKAWLQGLLFDFIVRGRYSRLGAPLSLYAAGILATAWMVLRLEGPFWIVPLVAALPPLTLVLCVVWAELFWTPHARGSDNGHGG